MLSVIILAGGKSKRMGVDKAFLRLRGRPFIAVIQDEMRKISNDVIVVIGRKERRAFKAALGRDTRIINDALEVETPVSGMLAGLDESRSAFAAVLACDLPMIKGEVIEYLHRRALGHSAAVPFWKRRNRVEPLCGVYKVNSTKPAALNAIRRGKKSCLDVLDNLPDVRYVEVSAIRRFDPELISLVNINTRAQYSKIALP